jgi:hypothetical protein
MSKPVKTPGVRKKVGGKTEPGAAQHFEDRNLMPVKSEQAFVPTPAEPVRMRFKMAGGC